jgi:hypothetical protein
MGGDGLIRFDYYGIIQDKRVGIIQEALLYRKQRILQQIKRTLTVAYQKHSSDQC